MLARPPRGTVNFRGQDLRNQRRLRSRQDHADPSPRRAARPRPGLRRGVRRRTTATRATWRRPTVHSSTTTTPTPSTTRCSPPTSRRCAAARRSRVRSTTSRPTTRTADVVIIEPRPVVVVEGILLLSFTEIATHLDLAVFIDVPEQVRLDRRIRRDVAERGREPDDVRRQFASTVAPMHDEFVEPYRTPRPPDRRAPRGLRAGRRRADPATGHPRPSRRLRLRLTRPPARR